MSDIVERLLRFRPVYGWPEETSTVVEKSLNQVAVDEITRLRSDLAAVTEERDRLRDALKPFSEMLRSYHACLRDDRLSDVNPRVGDLRRARAAYEGVKEPANRQERDDK